MQTPTPLNAAREPAQTTRLLRAYTRGLVLLAPVLLNLHLLAGCGGGDAEPDKPTPTVNCAAHPEACK